MAELAEVLRGQHHAPGSIEPRPMLQPGPQSARRAENVNEPEARASHRVMLGRILFGIGYIDVGANRLYIKRSKIAWDAIIIESIVSDLHRLEVGVKNVNV